MYDYDGLMIDFNLLYFRGVNPHEAIHDRHEHLRLY